MSTTTPIIPNVLILVREYGTRKAIDWLEGREELAIPDDDLTSFLARQDIDWDGMLTTDQQDQIRDVYLEAFKAECARRIAKSDCVPFPSRDPLLPANVAKHPEILDNAPETAPAASLGGSGVCVPDAVSALLRASREALQGVNDLHGQLYSSESYVTKWGIARKKCYETLAELDGYHAENPEGLRPPVQESLTAEADVPPAVEPGEGWRLLEEGEPLQEGDGFLMPDYPKWISFECRADLFRRDRGGRDCAHTWPWRRKVETQTAAGGADR